MPTFIENNNRVNAGWLFYRKYYSLNNGGTNNTIESINNTICRTLLLEIPALTSNSDSKFNVVTTYPGLVIGTGYIHDMKDENDAFKIGFSFDYTSGMPIIPGSSVKGLLRSAFPQRVVIPQKVTANQGKKEIWIKEILERKCGITGEVNVDELEREIFDGARKEFNPSNSGQIVINPIPLYDRDIFFDAVPIQITANNIGQAKRLLGSDYITPHKNKDREHPELDPFSEPNPLKFLKIMPKVKIEFRFKLEDSILIPQLTSKKKIDFFKEIVNTIGIGAKTNVGYGQFEPDRD